MGLNKIQASRKLDLDYKTVTKYWDISPSEFDELQKEDKSRNKRVEKYKDEILNRKNIWYNLTKKWNANKPIKISSFKNDGSVVIS